MALYDETQGSHSLPLWHRFLAQTTSLEMRETICDLLSTSDALQGAAPGGVVFKAAFGVYLS